MNFSETITDFVKDLKDRISSPFFSSFVISWIISNWKVSVAVLFYKQAELKVDGYASLIKLIQGEVDVKHGLFFPLGASFGYIIFYPLLKNLIIALLAWYKSWGSELELKYTKGVVSIKKYLMLRQNLEQRTEILQHALSTEIQSQQDFETLRSEKFTAVNKAMELNKELSDWKNTGSMLNGVWGLIFMDANNNVPKINPPEITIIDNKVFSMNNRTNVYADVMFFQFNPETKFLTFFLKPTIYADDQFLTQHFYLQFNDEKTSLSGFSNLYPKVVFESLKINGVLTTL